MGCSSRYVSFGVGKVSSVLYVMGCSSRYVPFGVGKVSSVLYVMGCSSRYVPFGVGKVSSVLYVMGCSSRYVPFGVGKVSYLDEHPITYNTEYTLLIPKDTYLNEVEDTPGAVQIDQRALVVQELLLRLRHRGFDPLPLRGLWRPALDLDDLGQVAQEGDVILGGQQRLPGHQPHRDLLPHGVDGARVAPHEESFVVLLLQDQHLRLFFAHCSLHVGGQLHRHLRVTCTPLGIHCVGVVGFSFVVSGLY